jgi:hypothetical protein
MTEFLQSFCFIYSKPVRPRIGGGNGGGGGREEGSGNAYDWELNTYTVEVLTIFKDVVW